jgi:cytochrome P450
MTEPTIAPVYSQRAPPAELLLGHAPAFNRDQLGFLMRLARNYGDLVPLRFTPFRGLFVNHPDLIEEVLVTRNRSFVKSLAMRRARPLLGNGLIVSEGDFWLRQRRLMQPAFHRERIAGYGQVMVTYAQQLVADWQSGDVKDIQQEMMRLTLQIVGKTLFDADMAGDAREVGAAVAAALESMQARITGLQMLLPDAVPTPAVLRLRRAARRLDVLVLRIIAERRASGQDRGDLLSVLLQARDGDDGSGMSDRQLRDEVMTLVIGGHETTALALTWTWYLLAEHPQVEAALHAELDDVLKDRAPEVADVARLPYCNAVIAEVLRLYPPLWATGREAIEDTRVGAMKVRRGTVVLLSPWTMHRDGRFFSEPDAFRPERWLDGLAQRLPRFAYYPFGGGPRQCIGNAFALTEATLLLGTIAQRYRLTLVPGQTVSPVPTSTLRPARPIMMQLSARVEAASPAGAAKWL